MREKVTNNFPFVSISVCPYYSWDGLIFEEAAPLVRHQGDCDVKNAAESDGAAVHAQD